jgi:hypothetical protein
MNPTRLISKIFDRMAFEKIGGLTSINYLTMILIIFSNIFKNQVEQTIEINQDDIKYEEIAENIEKYRIKLSGKYDLFDITLEKNFLKILNKIIYHLSSLKTDIVFDKYTVNNIVKHHLENEKLTLIREYGRMIMHDKLVNWVLDLANLNLNNLGSIFDGNVKINSYLENIIDRMTDNNIDISNIKNKLFGSQTNLIVKDLAFLNIFTRTNMAFNHNIIYDEILRTDITTNVSSFDYIFYEIPHDLHNMTHASCCKKVKNMKIRGTNPDALILQLIMSSLNDNGIAIVTVADPVIFGITEQLIKTRQYLVENFELIRIIHIDENLYYSKGVKSCILYFKNTGGLTKNIDVSKISLKDGVVKETNLMTLTMDTIMENNYSLHYKHYEETIKKPNDKITYDTVDNIFDIYNSIKEVPNKSTVQVLALSSYYKNADSVKKTTGDLVNRLTDRFTFIVQKKENKPEFYINYLQSLLIAKYEKYTKGKSFKFNMLRIKDIKIPLLSKSLNENIINYNTLSDNIIDNNNKQIENYENLKQQVLKSIPNDNEESIGKICKFYNGDSENNNKYTKFITVTKNGLSAGSINFTTEMHTDKLLTNLHYLVPISDNFLIEYVYHTLKLVEKKIIDIANLMDQPIMPQSKLLSTKIPIIDKDKQKEIIALCDEFQNNIDRLKQNNKYLQNVDIMTTILNIQDL